MEYEIYVYLHLIFLKFFVMSSFKDCIIPISGLNLGIHQYKITVNDRFFTAVQSDEIQNGDFDVSLIIDKKPKTVLINISIDGTIQTNCDRCLANIALPIQGEQTYAFKFVEELEETDDDEELVILDRNTTEIDLAEYIYETIGLSIPMIKTYDCESEENKPCDETTLKHLELQEDEQEGNPVWDILKNINN